MMRVSSAAGWVAIVLLTTSSTVEAQQEGGLRISAADADEAPLGEVAESPNSSQATEGRTPESLNPELLPGARFDVGYYRGVVPGHGIVPPRARMLKSARQNLVTWPGFEMTASGSRIFVQSLRPISYSRADEANRVVFVLQNTRIHLRNNRNPLVTESFNTPVGTAYLRPRGRDTLLILDMKVGSSPSISQVTEGGYSFLFLDFPGGTYPIPEGVREWRPRISVGGDGETIQQPVTTSDYEDTSRSTEWKSEPKPATMRR
jgi:hypothetical protein